MMKLAVSNAVVAALSLTVGLPSAAQVTRCAIVVGNHAVMQQRLLLLPFDIDHHLQHKSPIVEELEDRLLALGEHRAKAAVERIEADNEEEERPASAAVSAAMGVIGRGGAMAGQRRL